MPSKIGHPVKICTECYGNHYTLPVSCHDSKVLLNTGKNSVSIIEAEDQKIVQTWTLKHPHTFTSPATFHDDGKSICSIVDRKILYIWYQDTIDLIEAKKLKLHHPVYAVLCTSENVLIVFKSGIILPMDAVTSDNIPNSPIPEDEEIIWVNLAQRQMETIAVFITFTKRDSKHKMYSFHLTGDERGMQPLVCQILEMQNMVLKAWCLYPSSQKISLLTLWNSSDIFLYDINEEKRQHIFKIHADANIEKMHIDIVGKSHVAFVYSKDSSDSLMEIWDLKYLVKKCSRPLKQSFTKNFKMRGVGSSVFILSDEGLCMVPVRLEASTLASVVGKLPSADPETKDCSPRLQNSLKESKKTILSKTVENPSLLTADILFQNILPKVKPKNISKLCSELADASEIPEQEIVKMLHCALQLDEPSISEDDQNSEFVNIKESVLNAIFRIKFTDVYLRQHLKSLSLPEILAALKYLNKLCESAMFQTNSCNQPSDLEIVNWITVLVHSHMDELLFSSHNKKVLRQMRNLQQTITEKMEVYEDIHDIKTYLSVIKKWKYVPPKKRKECLDICW